MTDPVRDNPDASRFELEVDGQVAFATYGRDGRRLVIRHVEAPPALRGTGAAGRLMAGIMAIARAGGLTVLPHCSYAALWLQRHPEHRDLVG